jgi:hypothetical protein
MLLLFIFVGIPFFVFVVGLLTVYYCCTTDPIPFRTLLRAMIGVGDDWNGGAFSAHQRESYHVTKDDIRKGIIRRQCLGPMESETNVAGGDLSTLPKDYPGRVHWRKEDTDLTCLVFSEPLGSTLSEINSVNDDDPENSSDENMSQEGETVVANIPKYLQSHSSDVDIENNEKAKEEKEETKDSSNLDGMEDASTKNPEPVPSPVSPTPDEESQSVGPDDGSSVRDRGTVCDICLLEFETGEAVAWSPNPNCSHAYHEECITDWLMRKPTCPSCRQNFIVLPDSPSRGLMNDSDSDIDNESSDVDDLEHWGALATPSTRTFAGQDGDIELGISSAQS